MLKSNKKEREGNNMIYSIGKKLAMIICIALMGVAVSLYSGHECAYAADDQTGSLTLTLHTDTEPEEPISGMVISANTYDEITKTYNKVKSATSDEKGIVAINDLPYGEYWLLLENTPPEGLGDLSSKFPIKVTIGDSSTKKNVEASPESVHAKIIVKALDEEGNGISNLQFEISNGTDNISITTNTDGIAEANGLGIGTYTVKQKTKPDEYIINSQDQEVEIKETVNYTVTFRMTNKSSIKGYLKASVTKKATSEPVKNVGFIVYNYDTGDIVTEFSTDETGTAVSAALIYGKYTVKMESIPAGYKKKTAYATFEVVSSKTYTLKNIELEEESTENNGNGQNQEDKDETGSVILNLSFENKTVTVSGIQFSINTYDSKKKEYVSIAKATSDSNGKVKFENISYGDYRVVLVSESSEEGLKNKFPLAVTLNASQVTVDITAEDTTVKGLIQVEMHDKISLKYISGITFVIKDENNNIVSTIATGEDGKATSDILSAGVYTVEQITKPDEYIISSTTSQKVTLTQSGTTKVIFQMTAKDQIKGKLKVTVTNKTTKEPVAGVIFAIYDSNGTEITRFTTDGNGIGLTEELKYGGYKVMLEEVPTGFTKMKMSASFTVTAEKTYEATAALIPSDADTSQEETKTDDDKQNETDENKNSDNTENLAKTITIEATKTVTYSTRNNIDEVVSSDEKIFTVETSENANITIGEEDFYKSISFTITGVAPGEAILYLKANGAIVSTYTVKVTSSTEGETEIKKPEEVNNSDDVQIKVEYGKELIVDGYKVKLYEDGTAIYTGSTASTKIITIPDKIKVNSKSYKVTKISAKAFYKNKKITTVNIGAYVTEIGNYAFAYCSKLKTLTGGSKVKTIGKGAFMSDSKLATIPTLSKLEKIDAYAFKGCISIKTFTIGAKVNTIGKQAFKGATKLKRITIKSTKLTQNNIGTNAFKGVATSITFKCPKGKKAEYESLIKKSGAPVKGKFTE